MSFSCSHSFRPAYSFPAAGPDAVGAGRRGVMGCAAPSHYSTSRSSARRSSATSGFLSAMYFMPVFELDGACRPDLFVDRDLQFDHPRDAGQLGDAHQHPGLVAQHLLAQLRRRDAQADDVVVQLHLLEGRHEAGAPPLHQLQDGFACVCRASAQRGSIATAAAGRSSSSEGSGAPAEASSSASEAPRSGSGAPAWGAVCAGAGRSVAAAGAAAVSAVGRAVALGGAATVADPSVGAAGAGGVAGPLGAVGAGVVAGVGAGCAAGVARVGAAGAGAGAADGAAACGSSAGSGYSPGAISVSFFLTEPGDLHQAQFDEQPLVRRLPDLPVELRQQRYGAEQELDRAGAPPARGIVRAACRSSRSAAASRAAWPSADRACGGSCRP